MSLINMLEWGQAKVTNNKHESLYCICYFQNTFAIKITVYGIEF